MKTGKHTVMSPLELVLLAPENVSVLGPVEKWELAVDENTPAEALRLLCLEDTRGQLSHEIANNPNSPKDAVQLAETRLMSSEERKKAAKNTDNPYILEGLANDKYYSVRVIVALDSNTSRETLTELAGDSDTYVRAMVATNPSTPLDTLTMLASDEEWIVRLKVAENPSTPPEILTMLANDVDEMMIRKAVTMNRNTPTETLTMLASDEDKYVREAVAWNSNVPRETLNLLANDRYEDVREAAISTLVFQHLKK